MAAAEPAAAAATAAPTAVVARSAASDLRPRQKQS